MPEPEGPLVFGVDVGASAACSVVSAYWPACGRLSVLGAFGCAEISLEERGRLDGVSGLYRECARAGELLEQLDTRIGDVEALLREAMERFGAPDRIVADRWRISELRDALDKAQVPLRWPRRQRPGLARRRPRHARFYCRVLIGSGAAGPLAAARSCPRGGYRAYGPCGQHQAREAALPEQG